MSREYPRYAGKVSGTRSMKPTDLCEVCAAPATCWVEVQWTWFRGDDSAYKVCEDHRKLFRENTFQLATTAEDNRRAAVRRLAEGKSE